MTEPEDDDIYDVMPANEKTVSDIGKLKNMFEQKPMAQYSSGKPFPQTKAFQPTGSPGNKPVVAEKPKVGVGKLLIPKEIQDKQKEIISPKNDSAPSLPSKNNRVSIVNGSIRQASSQPPISKKSAPPPVAKKTKPTTPVRKEFPKAQPNDSNQNEVSKIESPKVDKPPEGSNSQPSSPRPKNDNGLNDGFDNNVKYIGETISAPNGNKYRMVECQSNPGPPPIKSRLPAKIDIDDIAQQYADDDDTYDDVLTDDPNSRISKIPEFTEDEEKELAKQAKKSTPKEDSFEQETYDDVRVDEQSDRKNKSLSMMSQGSDIYETFDELTEGADVKL